MLLSLKSLCLKLFLFLIETSSIIKTLLPEQDRKISLSHNMIVKNNKKTLNKCAIQQVTQCESEPQDIESTTIVATLHSNARSTTLKSYNLEKIHNSHPGKVSARACSKV